MVVEVVIKQDGGTRKESWLSVLLGCGSADVMQALEHRLDLQPGLPSAGV